MHEKICTGKIVISFWVSLGKKHWPNWNEDPWSDNRGIPSSIGPLVQYPELDMM